MSSGEETDYLFLPERSLRFRDRQSRMRSSSSSRYNHKFKERVPDRFDGSTPLRDYWVHFEACWDLNQWSDEEAALALACSLSKSACKVLIPKPKDSRGRERRFTISELKGRLDSRFGPGELAESFLAQLQTKRQGVHETLQELGEAIGELLGLAYPDVPDQFLERIGVIHFRDSIREAEIRAALYRVKPSSLDDAIKTAVETECWLKMEAEREEPKNVCTVEKTDEVSERLLKMEKHQKELMSWVTDVAASRKRTRKVATRRRRRQRALLQCFNCRELGHLQRNCPYLSCAYPVNNSQSASCPSDQDSGHLQTPASGVVKGTDASGEISNVAQSPVRVSHIVIRPEAKHKQPQITEPDLIDQSPADQDQITSFNLQSVHNDADHPPPGGETGTSVQDVDVMKVPEFESTLQAGHVPHCTTNQDSGSDTGGKVTERKLNHHSQLVSGMSTRDKSSIDQSNHVQSGVWVKYELGYTAWQVPNIVNGHWMPTYNFSVEQGLWLIWPVFMMYGILDCV